MILPQYGTKTTSELLAIIFASRSDLETDRAVNALIYKWILQQIQGSSEQLVYRKTIFATNSDLWDISNYDGGVIPSNWRERFLVFQNGLKVILTNDFTINSQNQIVPPADFQILGDIEILAYYDARRPKWYNKIIPGANPTVLDISDFPGVIPANWRDIFMVHQNGVKIILTGAFTLNSQNQIVLPPDFQILGEVEVIAIY